MHKKDPMRRYYWFFFICEGLVLIEFLFLAIASIIRGHPNYFYIIYCILFALLLIYVGFTFKRRHQRTEDRRQKALSGDPSMLAQPQPVPDANALTLPTRIHIRLSKKYMLEVLGVTYIIITLVTVGFIALIGQFTTNEPANNHAAQVINIPLLLFIIIILAAMLVLFLVTYLLSLAVTGPFVEQEIIVDEEGITTKFFRQHTHLQWSDVQSFAMWGNAKRFSTIQFELTSEHGVARWYQLGSRRKILTWLSALKPDLPFDEYHEKMDRLQQVIEAHTGKQLYDLRDEKIVWW